MASKNEDRMVSFKSGDAEDVSDMFFFFQLETRIAVSDMLFSETNLGGLSLSVSGGDLCSLQIIMFTPGFHGGIMG